MSWWRPERTVPTLPWSAGASNWRAKPRTLVVLLIGLWLCGSGEAALVEAGVGNSPWVVFQQGISLRTGWSIGWATFWVSAFVLLLWIPLRRKPGLGTVLNMIVIAISIQVMLAVFPTPTNRLLAVGQAILGIWFFGLGSALYITSNLGTGPRDGIMSGLHYLTGVSIGRVRLTIESVVLISGWLMGGTVGVGTVLFALAIGHTMAVWFSILMRLTGRSA